MITLGRIQHHQWVHLEKFFEEFVDDPHFHPHPMTSRQAGLIANYEGKDVYLGIIHRNVFVAYGILRGWDEGWDVPSLGIAVAKSYRGRGFGRLMMEALHVCARLHDAPAIRLKVYPDNTKAKALYESMGYEKQGIEGDGQLLYLLDLSSK